MMKYERLTIRNSDGSVSQPTHSTFEKVFNRLAELEDDLESGKIIRLPCKVGDTTYIVYERYREGWEIREVKVDNIGINFNNDFITDIGEYTPCYMVYGVNIFASREEAEKRLKELQE